MEPLLQISHLTKIFSDGKEDEYKAVDDVSFELFPGEKLAIIGESGSGKTTVIRAILGLLPGGGKVTGGTITFEGEDLLSYSAEKWRKLRGSDISMIFQDFFRRIHHRTAVLKDHGDLIPPDFLHIFL